MKDKGCNTLFKLLILLVLFTSLSKSVYGCAVCFSGTEETLWAFYITTLILIILPISMIMSVVYWLYKKKTQTVC